MSTAGVQGDAAVDWAIHVCGWPETWLSFPSRQIFVDGDTKAKGDVFVRDRIAGTTYRASVSSDGTPGDVDSSDTAISAMATRWHSARFARNLVPGDTNGMMMCLCGITAIASRSTRSPAGSLCALSSQVVLPVLRSPRSSWPKSIHRCDPRHMSESTGFRVYPPGERPDVEVRVETPGGQARCAPGHRARLGGGRTAAEIAPFRRACGLAWLGAGLFVARLGVTNLNHVVAPKGRMGRLCSACVVACVVLTGCGRGGNQGSASEPSEPERCGGGGRRRRPTTNAFYSLACGGRPDALRTDTVDLVNLGRARGNGVRGYDVRPHYGRHRRLRLHSGCTLHRTGNPHLTPRATPQRRNRALIRVQGDCDVPLTFDAAVRGTRRWMTADPARPAPSSSGWHDPVAQGHGRMSVGAAGAGARLPGQVRPSRNCRWESEASVHRWTRRPEARQDMWLGWSRARINDLYGPYRAGFRPEGSFPAPRSADPEGRAWSIQGATSSATRMTGGPENRSTYRAALAWRDI